MSDLNIEKCETLIIHVGGNDADNGIELNSSHEEFETLIDSVSDGTRRVIISGLLPRDTVDLEPYNEIFQSLCADNAVEFVDNYNSYNYLTSEKQGRSSTIQDKSGKCLAEEKEILSRWTEYCSELYNYESCGDNAVLDCSQPPEENLQPILREEVEIAVASLKRGKSAGVDNIPAELVQAAWRGDHDRCFNRDL